MKYDITISDFIGYGNASYDYLKWQLSQKMGKEVHVNICSLGGYVATGLKVYELFNSHGNVHVHFTGMSASAATVMAMAAKTVSAEKHSLILIHNASQGMFLWGNMNKEQIDEYVKSLNKTRKDLETIDDVIASCYADRCKKDITTIKDKMKDAAWLNAETALEIGIIDSIEDHVEEKDKNVVNAFTMSGAPQISNEQLKSLGLPPLPEQSVKEHSTSLLSKVAAAAKTLESIVSPTVTNTAEKPMKKNFAFVATILAMAALEVSPGEKVELSYEEMEKLDDALKNAEQKNDEGAGEGAGNGAGEGAGEGAGNGAGEGEGGNGEGGEGASDANESRFKALEDEIKNLKQQLEDRKKQVENLQAAPAEEKDQLQNVVVNQNNDFINLF